MSAQPLSLQELITLADPQKPLTRGIIHDVLGFVGLSETMLLEISNQPDANERLECIRLLVSTVLNSPHVPPIVTDLIASGRDKLTLEAGPTQLGDAALMVVLQVSNTPDTTDPTRTP